MSTRFPSIRVYGDKKAAYDLIAQGRQELYRTKEVQKKMGVPVFARTTKLSDDVYIRTHVAKDQEFIFIYVKPKEELEHEPISIPEIEFEKRIPIGLYSGFSYSHQYRAGELHQFNPTWACRAAYPDDFSSDTYESVSRLAVLTDPNLWVSTWTSYRQGALSTSRYIDAGVSVSQYNLIHPCQYSGPIARACSLALGNGTFNLTPEERLFLLDDSVHSAWRTTVSVYGFRVEYDFRASRIHNAVQDNLGRWWIIQISKGGYSGVFARPMPILDFNANQLQHPDEITAIQEFGGLPSGEAFPSAFTVDGVNYLQLLGPGDGRWDEFASQSFLAESAGWVFNDAGTVGRAVTYEIDSDGFMVLSYWELSFHIQASEEGTVTAYAVIDRLEKNRITRPLQQSLVDGKFIQLTKSLPTLFWDFPNGKPLRVYPPAIAESKYSSIDSTMEAVCWVGWIDGNWHTHTYRANKVEHYAGTGLYYRRLIAGEETGFSGDQPVYVSTNPPKSLQPDQKILDIAAPKTSSWEPEDFKSYVRDYTMNRWTTGTLGRNQIMRQMSSDGDYSNSESKSFQKSIHSWYVTQQATEAADRLHRVYQYLIAAPWNRNAYFIYDRVWSYGLSCYQQSLSTYHKLGAEYSRYRHANLPDAFVNSWCGPDYPHRKSWIGEGARDTQCTDFPSYLYPVVPPNIVAMYQALNNTTNHPAPPPSPSANKAGLTARHLDIARDIFYSPGTWFNIFSMQPAQSSPYTSLTNVTLNGDYDLLWMLASNVEFTECSGSSGCYCSKELYNRSACELHFISQRGILEDDSLVDNSDRLQVLGEHITPGASEILKTQLDQGEEAGFIDSVFSYAKKAVGAWAWRDRFYYNDYEWKLNVQLVSSTIKKDFGTYVSPGTEGGIQGQFDEVVNPLRKLVEDVNNVYNYQWWRAFWCQESVLGEKSALYSDPTKITEDTETPPYINMDMESYGTHPALPTAVPYPPFGNATTDYNDTYRYLTYVGVNGP